MPVITLSEAAFEELKLIAEPFVDTPESLVGRLIHEEVLRRGKELPDDEARKCNGGQIIKLDPDWPEDLTHTRLLSASLDGRPVHRPKWNGILHDLHVLGLKKLRSVDKLCAVSTANIRNGRYEDDGYKYVPDADLSIQSVGAKQAWDKILDLARALGVSVSLNFEWRDKDGAVHPGMRGQLEWSQA
ncbi:MAG: hypothetical protein HND57_09780 [Planctomycetes bacterium]|nr:hypothetical protein [Planctomycetota bacterium]